MNLPAARAGGGANADEGLARCGALSGRTRAEVRGRRTRDVGDGEVLLVVADGLDEVRVVGARLVGHLEDADAVAREGLADG
eukprot:1468603-Prymnesium_polylepis.1